MESKSKQRILGAFCVFAGVLAIASLFYACNDFGVEADFFKGIIRGELQIRTAVPDTSDEIRVALAKEFPPTSLQDLITGENLITRIRRDTSSQIVPFEMRAPYGEYGATIVIWKAKAQSFQLTDIVGVYGNLERFELNPIVLNSENPVAENVNIPVDLNRVNRISSIQGGIEFVGAWPENTAIVALVVLKNFADLTKGIPPALTFIPKNAQEFDYRVGVAPDTYNFVFVAWLPIGEFDLGKVRIIGVYENPPGSPGSVVVPDSINVTGIDITADFANITP